MPSFMFAVGFSFRLTYLRRRSQSTRLSTIWTYVRRSLALIVVSLVMYGFGGEFKEWAGFDHMPAEFEPFRVKAPHTNSFDLLVSKAKEENPGKDLKTTLDAASKIGETLNGEEPKKAEEKKRFAVAQTTAQKVAREAIEETQGFVQPAVERKTAWEAIGPTSKFLMHWQDLRREAAQSRICGKRWRSSASPSSSCFP